MESKTKAQNELQQGSFEQLEEYNRRIRDLRRQVQEAQHDKEVAESRSSRAEEFEEQVRELSEQNRYLEDQVTRLCEAPFLSGTGARSAVTDFDRQERAHKQKIDRLQEVAQTHHAALTALQKETDILKKEKIQLQKQLDQNLTSGMERNYASQISKDKSSLFGSMSDLQDLGMEDLDMKELERALAIVRRKMDDPTDLDFLERVDDEDLTTVPALKKRLQIVQVANLNITRELERAERMLKAQASINRDLHLEIEESNKRSRTEKDSLQAKLEDFESLCLKRLQRIHTLEAQVRQHLYSVSGHGSSSKFKKIPNNLDDVVGLLDEEDNLLQEVSNGDFGPDENLIEVYVVDAEISESTVSSDASTFVIVDFFDYESQATPLTTGLYPRYDFATTYKVTVDDFFLRFLATDSLSIELNKAQSADYALLARGTIILSSLLESVPKIIHQRLPLISTQSGSIAGYVHIEIRMALPITELYRLFLDRHPEERSRIEAASRSNLKQELVLTPEGTTANINSTKSGLLNDLGPREEARLSNELSVTVKSISGLSKRGRRSPSTYVHYQLLGFQDTFTNVSESSTDPIFDHSVSFPIVTDPKLLRFLRKYKIQFTVFDDKDAGEDDGNADADNADVIGESKVSLAPLGEGEAIDEDLPIHDSNGRQIGKITIEIKWNSPLKRPADAGPNALTAPEVEEIMSRFSPEKDGQVCYTDFVRFAEPQPAVVAALQSFHEFLVLARKEQGITTNEFFEAICQNQTDAQHNLICDNEKFVSGLMKMEINIPPDELEAVFTHINVRGKKTVTLQDFKKFAEPSSSSSTAIITEKLRKRCQHLHRLGTPIMVPFQKADISGSGRITRLQFKECLRSMGFHLVDDDFLNHNPAQSTITSKAKPFSNIAQVSDDVDDEDEIIGGHATSDFKEMVNERFDSTQNNSANTNAKQQSVENEKKRIEFEKRVKELNQNTNAQTASVDLGVDSDNENDLNITNKKRINKPPSGRSPRSSFNKTVPTTQAEPQPYETPLIQRPDMAATHPGVRNVSEAIDSAALEETDAASEVVHLPTSSMNIIDVESHLSDTCKHFKGAKVLPEGLKKALQAADETNEGYLPRRRFASVITSLDSMANLSPEALKSTMDYFQKTKTGSQIDYRSFLNFMSWKKPSPSNGFSLMSKMLLHAPSALDEFAKFDPEGQGYVRRVDFYNVLREIGYGHISSSDMDDISMLFEFSQRRGEIYYSAFVEYVTQQESALSLREVENNLRSSIFNQYNKSDDGSAADSLRSAFAEFDTDSTGFISQENFQLGLDKLGFKLTKSELESLYIRADPRGEGVTYKDFVDFITNSSDNEFPEQQKSRADFDMALLQLKCHAVVIECQKRLPNLESLAESFKHYDYKRAGKLPLRSFAAAVRCAGFTLTRAEIVVLAQHFGKSSADVTATAVPYGDFLNWATPDDHSPPPILGGAVNMESLMANLRRLAARSENGSFVRWSDVFEAVDTEASGFVDEDGARLALKKLGCKITEAEARALSVEFGGGKKTAIRYRALLRLLFPGSSATTTNENKVGAAALRRLQAASNRIDMDLAEITRTAREIFSELDLDGIGYFSKRSFKRGMKSLINKTSMATLSDNDMDELMARYDTAGDGSVGWKEMIAEAFAGGGNAAGDELEAVSRFKNMMRKCIRKGIDYRAAFESCDQGFKGSITIGDFKTVMGELGSGMTEGEINALALKFRTPTSVRNSGSGLDSDARVVLYLEMLHSLMPVRPSEWEDPDGWRTEEKLRSMIKNRFEFWVPGKLKKAFKFFDRPTPRGKLNISQLADGLKRLKAFRMSASQEKQLFNIMDLSGKGWVDFSDFCVFVKDANHFDVAAKVVSELTKGGVGKKEVKTELEKFDENMSGLISQSNFKKALEKVGVTLSKSDCSRLVMRFDDEESGNLSIDKFFEFVKCGGMRKNAGEDEDDVLDDDDDDEDDSSEEEGDEKGKKKKSTKKKSKKESSGVKISSLMKKLKAKLQKAEEKGVSGKRSFEFFDKDGNGYVDEKEFMLGVKKLMKVVLTKKETTALMDKFGGKKNGRIKYDEFLKGLKLSDEESESESESESEDSASDSEEETTKSARKKGKKSSKRSKSSDGDVAKMVRKEIVRLSRQDKKPKLKSVFKTFDKNGNGKLSLREFKRALTKMEFKFSTSQVEKLTERLDEDGDGEISWKEFERFSKVDVSSDSDNDNENESDDSSSSENEMSKNDLKKVVVKQMKKLIKRGERPKVKKVFSRLDVEGGDFVSKRDFKRGLQDLGFEFDANVVKQMLKKFDKKKDGKIYYLQFEKMSRVEDEEEEATDIDDVALMVRKELKRIMRKSGDNAFLSKKTVKKEFKRADSNGDGTLSAREFKKCVASLGFKFKTDEIDKLVDYLDSDGDGTLNFEEFCNLVGQVEKDDDKEKDGTKEDVDDLALMVRKELKKLTRASGDGPPRIRVEFQKVDSSGDGELSSREFKKCLKQMGFKFKDDDVDRLMDYLDSDGDGRISYKEFEDLVTFGDEEEEEGGVIDELVDNVTRAIDRGRDALEAFEYFDSRGNGEINEDDFKEGLAKLKIKCGKSEAREAFKKFEGKRVGKIRYKEFVRFVEKKRVRKGEGDSKRRRRDDIDEGSGSENEEVDELVELVRKEFKRITKSSSGPPRVRSTFEDLDSNGDGDVSKREFRNGLEQMGFNFSDRKVRELLKRLDKDGDGTVDYEEFERLCVGKNSSRQVGFDIDNRLMKKMKRARIAKKTSRMSDKLEEYSNGRSSVSVRDLESFLRDNFDGELSRNEIRDVVEACDENDTGKIKCNKFVDMFE